MKSKLKILKNKTKLKKIIDQTLPTKNKTRKAIKKKKSQKKKNASKNKKIKPRIAISNATFAKKSSKANLNFLSTLMQLVML